MPRWDRVKKSFFDWERLTDSFPRLLEAFVLDIKIFAWTTPCILIAAVFIAIARSTRNPALFPVRVFVIAYTDIMRGVPVILWIYLVGFGVPGIGLERPWNSPLIWGSVALGLTYSAYVAEVFRAGIDKAKFANFTPFVGAALIFLAITIPLTRLTDWLLTRERDRTGASKVR